MASSENYIKYVCDQIAGIGEIRYRKMFGEYMVYVNEKPVLIVCDNNVFVKKMDCLAGKMQDAQTGHPYKGAKEHYILDIDNGDLSKEVTLILVSSTPIPKRTKK